jgi:hypothetical protein
MSRQSTRATRARMILCFAYIWKNSYKQQACWHRQQPLQASQKTSSSSSRMGFGRRLGTVLLLCSHSHMGDLLGHGLRLGSLHSGSPVARSLTGTDLAGWLAGWPTGKLHTLAFERNIRVNTFLFQGGWMHRSKDSSVAQAARKRRHQPDSSSHHHQHDPSPRIHLPGRRCGSRQSQLLGGRPCQPGAQGR